MTSANESSSSSPTLQSSHRSSGSRNAALLGASMAFGHARPDPPPVKPKFRIDRVVTPENGVDGGALAMPPIDASMGPGCGRSNTAATRTSTTKAGSEDQRVGSESVLAMQSTGSSIRSHASGVSSGVRGHTNQFGSPVSGNGNGYGLLRPGLGSAEKDGGRRGSASMIAATLAASRSASVSPNLTGYSPSGRRGEPLHMQELRRGLENRRDSDGNGRGSSEDKVVRESIPSTQGLIGLFEQNVQKSSMRRTPSNLSQLTTASQDSFRAARQGSVSVRYVRPQTRAPDETTKPNYKAPKPLPAQSQREHRGTEIRRPSPPLPSLQPLRPTSRAIPIPPTKGPSRSLQTRGLEAGPEDDVSSDDSFVSASDTASSYKPSFRATLSERSRSRPATSNISTQAQTVDSLANAIVASSLASSRAASPAKSSHRTQDSYPFPPPPPPPRRHTNNKLLFHSSKSESRTPSPAKQGMKMTLRKIKSREDVDEGEKRRAKKNLMKKAPNKHHEGDRKRWRDSITERERKRYEAVWASNRGLLLPSPAPPGAAAPPGPDDADDVPVATGVCNLVVKDVYSRSRLNDEVLEEVYELVDRKGVGWLAREEFVVGLWLIDQRLKGRKLPVRVSDSVWKSVGILGEIKIRKAGR